MGEKLKNEIISLVSKVINKDLTNCNENVSLARDLGVDSLLALEIMTALEKKFQIEIKEEDLVEFNTIKNILLLAKRYIKNKD